MARLLSLPVLGGAALIASPALRAAFVDGTMSVETAMGRFAVAVVFLWVGLTFLGSLVEGTSAPARPRDTAASDGSAALKASVVSTDD